VIASSLKITVKITLEMPFYADHFRQRDNGGLFNKTGFSLIVGDSGLILAGSLVVRQQCIDLVHAVH